MGRWAVQDAKARFGKLLATCLREGPLVVTRRGTEAAVLAPAAEWRRLQQLARLTLKEPLAPTPRVEFELPRRGAVFVHSGLLAVVVVDRIFRAEHLQQARLSRLPGHDKDLL